jgi:glycosyltransferase involved in cell wall biosynthesis
MPLNDLNNIKPLSISAVIPAYNAGAFISRAIESVLAQTRRADEIIVVDDGSTDDTAEQAQKYGDQVRYIYQENAGAGAARNTGIKAARYEWIAFLDGDDEWLPEKLRLQLELLQRNPDLVWVTSNYYRCLCEENRRSPDIATARATRLLGSKEYSNNFFSIFLQDAYGCTDTIMVKREVLEETGGFRAGQRNAEDMDLWWRIACRQPKIGFVNQPLVVYHLGIPQSLSRGQKKWEQYRKMIERHLILASELGRSDDVRPCAAYVLRRWLRGMLFDSQGKEIRQMLRQFPNLLPSWYKAVMWCLTVFPRVSAAGCHTISWIVRRLRLRKKPVRKPS